MTVPPSPSLRERSLLLETTVDSSLPSMLRSRPKRGSSLSWSLFLGEIYSITFLRYECSFDMANCQYSCVQCRRFDEKRSAFYTTELVLGLQFLHERVIHSSRFFTLFQGLHPPWHQTGKRDAYHGRSHEAYRLWHVQKGLHRISYICVWLTLFLGHEATKPNNDVLWHPKFHGPWNTPVQEVRCFSGLVIFSMCDQICILLHCVRWALGILTFSMLVGVPPFQARGDAVFQRIKTGNVVFPARYVRYQRIQITNIILMARRYQEKHKNL